MKKLLKTSFFIQNFSIKRIRRNGESERNEGSQDSADSGRVCQVLNFIKESSGSNSNLSMS